ARKLRDQSQKAYDDILPLVKIDHPKNPFKVEPPDVWLEIGFGGGEHMLEQLAQNPIVAMIGCEPFMNGVAKLLAQLPAKDYDRTRIWHEDVRYLLDALPRPYFNRAFILFPDPWPKKRHQRRRLITNEFMEKLWPTLKEGAHLHIASDDMSYVEQIQDVLYGYPNLILCEGPASSDPLTWSPRPKGWPETRYEQKALASGKKCAYMLFQKKENHS
ncbi:MAG TPA: tRNA (guanosine(46)-N7)-methyltransferase TrmB, partial [Alphaproteobacteria bacterium]|nr:tRNA (guanosine(46)-N7)-methyltransferase TrmB [Alphaproteobacteria bacterium]